MDNVIQLNPYQNIPEALRDIAEAYENKEYEGEDCTLIIGTDVFHLGPVSPSQAAVNAIWNMTFGIHKLMNRAVNGE